MAGSISSSGGGGESSSSSVDGVYAPKPRNAASIGNAEKGNNIPQGNGSGEQDRTVTRRDFLETPYNANPV